MSELLLLANMSRYFRLQPHQKYKSTAERSHGEVTIELDKIHVSYDHVAELRADKELELTLVEKLDVVLRRLTVKKSRTCDRMSGDDSRRCCVKEVISRHRLNKTESLSLDGSSNSSRRILVGRYEHSLKSSEQSAEFFSDFQRKFTVLRSFEADCSRTVVDVKNISG